MPDPLDFEAREGIPYSGWPFSLTYLEPWYRRAHSVLQLGPGGYAASDWGILPGDVPQPFRGPHFICQEKKPQNFCDDGSVGPVV